MAENSADTRSWQDLAIGLDDRLTGRGAEIDSAWRAEGQNTGPGNRRQAGTATKFLNWIVCCADA